MEELKYINSEEYEAAKKEKLNYNLSKNSIIAPHFVFYVKEKLIEKYGITILYTAPTAIRGLRDSAKPGLTGTI